MWIVGVGFALIAGHFGTEYFLRIVRQRVDLGEMSFDDPSRVRVPPWITGIVERTFFVVAVGVELSGVGTAMIGWLALKLATNWNHPDFEHGPQARAFAFAALLGGLVSMLFATIGGLIARAG